MATELEILEPKYHAGSRAKGWYQYRVLIQTVRVNRRESCVAIGDKKRTREEAMASAVAAGDQLACDFRSHI